MEEPHTDAFAAASVHVREFWAGAIRRVHVDELTEASFLRDYVAPSRPVVLLGAVAQWRALTTWQGDAGLRRMVSAGGADSRVCVNVTPSGRGDALVVDAGEELFVTPAEVTVRFEDAVASIVAHASACGGGDGATAAGQAPAAGDSASAALRCGTPYLSSQNDNMRASLPGLLADVCGDARVLVASDALGTTVEATNLWVGCGANVSTLHRDPFDNIYSVVRGAKRFVLLPPADVLWLYERTRRAATFVHDSDVCMGTAGASSERSRGCWRVVPKSDGSTVPWCAVDPAAPDLARFPLFANASPVTIDILPGETLFLPALWYHRVSHPTPHQVTVAVNSWRDMTYMSGAYACHALLHDLARLTTREQQVVEEREVGLSCP